MGILNYLTWLKDSAPVYQKYFFDGPGASLFLVLIPAYILFQPLLKAFVARNDVYQKYRSFWKALMVPYNLLLMVFSLYCAVKMHRLLLYETNGTFGVRSSNFTNPEYAKLIWYFYVSKYVEFLDTIFLIIQKKPVSMLQWIHHIGAPLDMGILYYTQDPGAHLFVLLNGYIHTLLYAYYAATISGIKIPHKWVLTLLQLFQFNLGFYWYTFFPQMKEYENNKEFMASHLFTWVYVLIVEGLFLHFFYQEFLVKKPRNTASSGPKDLTRDLTHPVIAKGAEAGGLRKRPASSTAA